jgi:NTE family protein
MVNKRKELFINLNDKMRFQLPHILLFISFLFFPLLNKAENQNPAPESSERRLKLGLVLSGGGAKGMAHVGVLRVLEEEGIKPDYITGTSMGSIVGGLYALGFSVDSIEAMIKDQDWGAVLSNSSSLRYMNTEEKREYDNYIMEFPIEGVIPKLPSGAIKGHELELILSKLTCSAAGIQDFDSLPIPFRAIATDMLTGDEFVFHSGDLSLAMRSSMSIPTIMEPIRYKGMLLVDGGLVNNFPVEICKEMGADIIIGSYTGGVLVPEDQLDNMYSLLKQSSLMMGIKDAEIQRDYVDIYIEPNLDRMSAAEFERYEEFIEKGYEAANEERMLIKKLYRIMSQYSTYSSELNVDLVDSVKVVSMSVEGLMNGRSKKFAERYLTLDSGEVYTVHEIRSIIDKLYGTRLYDKISYNLDKQGEGMHVRFNFIESDLRMLKFGVGYTNERKIGLNLAFQLRNFILPGSKLLLKTRISEYPSINFSYLIYLGKNANFGLKYDVDFNINDVPLYNMNVLMGQYKRRYSSAFTEMIYFPSYTASLSLGIGKEGIVNKPIIDNSNLAIIDFSQTTTALRLRYVYNSMDRKNYPYKGTTFNLQVKEHWGTEYSIFYNEDSIAEGPGNPVERELKSYPNFIAKVQKVHPIKDRWTLNHDAFLAISLNQGDVELNSFLLGGVNAREIYQIPFWGLPENYSFFNNGLVYRISGRYEPYENVFITLGLNGAFVSNDYREIKNDYYNLDQYQVGYGIDFGYLSPIGPISISFTKNTRYSTIWSHFRLSYLF